MGVKHVLKSRTGAVVAGAAVLALMAGGAGYAAGQVNSGDIRNNSIRSVDVKNHNLRGVDVKKRSLNAGHLTRNAVKRFSEDQGAKVAGFFENYGDPVTIEHIGGSFGDRATDVGTLELDAGVYLVNASAVFDTLAADSPRGTDTHLQLQVSGPETDDYKWGDYGTCFTGAFPAGDRELSCATTRLVKLDQATTLTVKAFGYNDDQSATGSGSFTVQADVSAVRVS